MSHNLASQRLSYRIAAESQLLAEEKWIIEALKKIRTQKNCLQIERLQLESMKSQLLNKEKNSKQMENTPSQQTAEATSSMVNLMQNKANITGTHIIEFDANMEAEILCNEEELNLSVIDPHYSNAKNDFNMEEDEDEEIVDEDVIIDMNMLMNGTK